MRVSHRVTYCDQVGRSKQQQTVVVTANNKRAEACLVEVVSAFVCVHVCLWSRVHAASSY